MGLICRVLGFLVEAHACRALEWTVSTEPSEDLQCEGPATVPLPGLRLGDCVGLGFIECICLGLRIKISGSEFRQFRVVIYSSGLRFRAIENSGLGFTVQGLSHQDSKGFWTLAG